MPKELTLEAEFVSRNNLSALAAPQGDDLTGWAAAYFSLAVTTAESSRKVF